MKKKLYALSGKQRVSPVALLLLLLWIAFPAFPQNAITPYPYLIPSSPTVASIEKFGDYPIAVIT